MAHTVRMLNCTIKTCYNPLAHDLKPFCNPLYHELEMLMTQILEPS